MHKRNSCSPEVSMGKVEGEDTATLVKASAPDALLCLSHWSTEIHRLLLLTSPSHAKPGA